MAKQSKHDPAVGEEILDRLYQGELITRICDEDGMPSSRTVQRWRREDEEFDNAVWRAQAAGLMIQRDRAYQILQDAADNPGPGTATRAQVAREMLHDVRNWASKLVDRMVDRRKVENTGDLGLGPLVISWSNSMPCKRCGYVDQGAPDNGLPPPSHASSDTPVLPGGK